MIQADLRIGMKQTCSAKKKNFNTRILKGQKNLCG